MSSDSSVNTGASHFGDFAAILLFFFSLTIFLIYL